MDPDPPPNCEYRYLCRFYDEECNKEQCYRKVYFDGVINERVKNLIKENKLEKIINLELSNKNNIQNV